MMVDKGIKIQNVYYMLSYAFKVLRESGYEKVGCEEFQNTADLLSAILAKGIEFQVKRGLGREYIPISESLRTVRGKIDISASIKDQTMRRRQLICDYDEFSINTELNQIIKTTVAVLLKAEIPNSRKKAFKNLMMYFKDIDEINPYTINWNVKFHRNNQSYQMLINVCYLIIKGLLQTDSQGNIKLQKFLDEQRMCRLYEKFILEYYKTHFPDLNVAASQIKWQADALDEHLLLLPTMQSDIMLSKKDSSKVLIIDAKYYAHTMQLQYDKLTIHSNNLYQIFTYVKNASIPHHSEVSGMLLYAETSDEFTPEANFNMSGNQIYVRTLDLNANFQQIQEQLNAIVIMVFG